MKKILKTLALLVISASLITCDALEEADDITFHSELEIVFETDSGVGETDHYDVRILDLTNDPEINEHIDKIKKIEITNITYRISGYTTEDPCTGSAVIFNNGTASFGPFDTNVATVIGNYAAGASGVNLQTTTTETDLDFDADQFKDVAEMLLDDKQVKMYSEGVLSCAPVAFNVHAKFYVAITANAIQ